MLSRLSLAVLLLGASAAAQTTIINPLTGALPTGGGGSSARPLYDSVPPQTSSNANRPSPASTQSTQSLKNMTLTMGARGGTQSSSGSSTSGSRKQYISFNAPFTMGTATIRGANAAANPSPGSTTSTSSALSSRTASIRASTALTPKQERFEKNLKKAVAERFEKTAALSRREVALTKGPERRAAIEARHELRTQDRIMRVREGGGLTRFRSEVRQVNGKNVLALVDGKGNQASFKDLPRGERNKLNRQRKNLLKEVSGDLKKAQRKANKLRSEIASKDKKIAKLTKKKQALQKKPAPKPKPKKMK
jgi:hypothetical protein